MGTLTPAQATVISSVISGLVAVLICIWNNRSQAKQKKIDDAVRDAKQELWMQSVDKKLDIHNGYAEKFGEIQTDIAVIRTTLELLKEK